jgi:hypothetical protein
MDLTNLSAGLNFSEAYEILKPLALFIIGMVVYSVFIFKFYRLVARKEIFKLNLQQYSEKSFAWLRKLLSVIFYIIEYILLFPVFTFFWFIVFSVLLSFLTREQTVQNILLVSIALVSSIRITAYHDEDLSKDLAKMLPFALLGIFLVDVSYFSVSSSLAIIRQIPSFWRIMVYYLIFAIVLELILRISYNVLPFKSEKEKSSKEK